MKTRRSGLHDIRKRKTHIHARCKAVQPSQLRCQLCKGVVRDRATEISNSCCNSFFFSRNEDLLAVKTLNRRTTRFAIRAEEKQLE
jgi:hypothetical protein